MEYYPAVKNNNNMNFAGKWVELKKMIVNEEMKIQKDKHHMLSSSEAPCSKCSEMSMQPVVTTETRKVKWNHGQDMGY